MNLPQIEVFWFAGSTHCWRVLLALELKRVEYKSHRSFDPAVYLKSKELLAVNRRRKVPVLRAGKCVLTESLAILRYVDQMFPDPPIFGATPEETALIWTTAIDFDHHVDQSMTAVILPLFVGQVDEKADEIKSAAAKLRNELAVLETSVQKRDWLIGAQLSAADIAIFPMIEALLRAAGKDAAAPLDLGILPFQERYPSLANWRRNVTKIPGYDRAYPPNWRDSD